MLYLIIFKYMHNKKILIVPNIILDEIQVKGGRGKKKRVAMLRLNVCQVYLYSRKMPLSINSLTFYD
jgi:hypothetical protein